MKRYSCNMNEQHEAIESSVFIFSTSISPYVTIQYVALPLSLPYFFFHRRYVSQLLSRSVVVSPGRSAGFYLTGVLHGEHVRVGRRRAHVVNHVVDAKTEGERADAVGVARPSLTLALGIQPKTLLARARLYIRAQWRDRCRWCHRNECVGVNRSVSDDNKKNLSGGEKRLIRVSLIKPA